MKVIHLNHSDINGGAARAAYRIHHALRQSGVDSRMWVNSATSGEWTVQGPEGKAEKLLKKFRPTIGGLPCRLLQTGNPIIHSPALLPSDWVKKLNASDADIVHMHWVAGEMLSIKDIAAIKKPIVWTLHDMWAFCGAEHVTSDMRWQEGYSANNRPYHESGFDLNRWTWERKRKHWQKPLQIVTPSRWLAQCVKESKLMEGWPVTVIPNALDVEKWKPVEKEQARQLLHLPKEVPLLLFGAMGGGEPAHKGFDLLLEALTKLSVAIPEIELIVFGQLPPENPPVLGAPIHYTGHLHDDVSLQLLYSAADVMVIPSRQDNLPNTGKEALSSGTPVVAFDTCGLPDIVDHETTGYLAKAFEPDDLAKGIMWLLEDRERLEELGRNARRKAEAKFAYPVVAGMYSEVYERVASNVGL
ncbi:glycosyl transferase [Prosthecochloris sp. ZM]|uniref:glycosyltransferase family 4 protein n=1 Tax=Prosthecochloris sp. ZM TaxID=2283143 RepID=UPI000DF78748|nr:glycosyltransferase family 4 protein [Prosthecochloris sp. ZM]RDD29681.1 glycosyl transferase [Prosthecochloris sp. ZM]